MNLVPTGIDKGNTYLLNLQNQHGSSENSYSGNLVMFEKVKIQSSQHTACASFHHYSAHNFNRLAYNFKEFNVKATMRMFNGLGCCSMTFNT